MLYMKYLNTISSTIGAHNPIAIIINKGLVFISIFIAVLYPVISINFDGRMFNINVNTKFVLNPAKLYLIIFFVFNFCIVIQSLFYLFIK